MSIQLAEQAIAYFRANQDVSFVTKFIERSNPKDPVLFADALLRFFIPALLRERLVCQPLRDRLLFDVVQPNWSALQSELGL